MKKLIASAALVALTSAAYAQTFVTSDVTVNTTWSGTVILENTIFVRGNATLTIQPGTIVRGQPRTAAVQANVIAGSPGALIVTNTGRINANGSSSSPIIFTTAATDNNDDGIADTTGGFYEKFDLGDTFLDDTPTTAPLAPLNLAGNGNVALWGGVVILGNAPTNNADRAGVGYGKATIEGLTVPGYPAAYATYGGVLPHDNSGSLTFASIRHAGDEIGNSNELNGLSLGGVGDGTRIENVEIYCNFDDGFEWFGGTVNGKNLVCVFSGDDSFDLDEGYTGTNQFLFAVMPWFNEEDYVAPVADNPATTLVNEFVAESGLFGSASGDKLGEFDGDNYRPDNATLNNNVNVRDSIDATSFDTTPWPLSNPSVWNLTGIGSTPTAPAFAAPVSAAATNRGLQFRNGYAGSVYNSVVVNTGGETAFEVGTGTGAPGFNVGNNTAAGLLTVSALTGVSGSISFSSDETLASTNGNTLATRLGATGTNVFQNTTPTYSGLIQRDPTFAAKGNATGKLVASLKATKLNPRTAGSLTPNLGGLGVVPQGANLDRSATYRGAFSTTAPRLWTTGWTALNIGGIMVD